MKLTATLTALLLCFGLSNLSAEDKIPEKLHGYWLFDAGTKGNWDQILIGENYVEHFYSLYQLDSLHISENRYEFWLSNKIKGKIQLKVDIKSDSTADFKFSETVRTVTASLRERHPDMTYFNLDEIKRKMNGSWIMSENFTNEFRLKKDKILLDGQEWDIVWFGAYLDMEHRALLRNGKEHRLIFIKKAGKATRIDENEIARYFRKKAKNTAVYQVLGNWYEPVDNRWTFGFFEDFVIYNGQVWNYDKFNFKNNKGVAVLKGPTQTIALNLLKTGDSTLSIKTGKAAPVVYQLAADRLPEFQTVDNTPFKNTHFASLDTAYITGYLRNAPNQAPFSIAYWDIVTDEFTRAYGDLDSSGHFAIKVPLYNTSQITLDWGRMNKTDVLEPGEKYFLYYDFLSDQYLFMGDNARIHTELSQYNPHLATPWNRSEYAKLDKMNNFDYVEAQKVRLEEAKTYLARHVTNNPNLSSRFKYFAANFSRYSIGSELMQRRFSLNRREKDRFPKVYMEFVTDSLFSNPVTPHTLVGNFSTFIRDYTEYLDDDNAKNTRFVTFAYALKKLIDDGKIQASASEKHAVNLTHVADSVSLVDSLEAANLYEGISEAERKLYRNLKSQHESEIKSLAGKLLFKNILNDDVQHFEMLIRDPDLLSTQIAQRIYEEMKQSLNPLDEESFAYYSAKITSPAFIKTIDTYQQYLKALPDVNFAYAASLKNTDHLKQSKDADSIFKQIIAPYKGKVIYLDFWGTWCGPCKQEMKYVNNAKDALKDKEVVFMYLANNSPENTWKNFIKDMNLTGENVIHYRLPEAQQRLVERRLSIRSFPTYMLIDKNGNIVDTTAPRPSQKDELVSAVTNLLK